MEDLLYIRIRGRVQGPFEMERLRALARRGQFSRMHQVSSDGTQWQSASDFPELFTSPLQAAPPEPVAPEASTTNNTATQASSHTSPNAATWFYAQGESQFGPVDFETLKDLVGQGQLKASDVVWTEGMSNWATAESLAGLADLFQNRQTSKPEQHSQGASLRDAVGHDLLRTLGDSQGWVLFIAVVGYLYTLGWAMGGIFLLASARAGGGAAVAGGLINLIQAALFAAGSTLLLRYRSQVTLARYEKTEARLDAAFRALGRFWLFTGIVLLVALIGLGVIMIMVISIDPSLQ